MNNVPNYYYYGNSNYYESRVPEEFKKFQVRFIYSRQSTSSTPMMADISVPTEAEFLEIVAPNAYKIGFAGFPWRFYIDDIKRVYIANNGNLFLIPNNISYKENYYGYYLNS